MEKIKIKESERVDRWYNPNVYVPVDGRTVVGFTGEGYMLCRYLPDYDEWRCGLFKYEAPMVWTYLPRL